MQTYLTWLTRLLIFLTVICVGAVVFMYITLNSGAPESAKRLAMLYSALLGSFGFGISALAAHFIARNVNNS